ncbi:MAG: DUF899 family protein [Myxococcales bacterium]|nr:DUF899 family protein [Myxococcales bacterium]
MSDRLANETPEYRKLRAELLEAEIALKDQCERVAQLRRGLPATPVETDWVLRAGPDDLSVEGPLRDVRLSELFGEHDTLVLMHFMYGGAQESPCPMCSMWADGYDGVVKHLEQHVAFAVCVEGDLATLRAFARERGWGRFRCVSSGGSSLKDDLRMQTPEGGQLPGVSVFTRSADGVCHTYTQSAMLGNGHFRGMDLLSPVWNFLDLTPAGRGDWMPGFGY